MKRFVDLRHTQVDAAFAFYCTVTDSFERHSGNQTWDSAADFMDDYRGSDIQRYKSLLPEWTFLAQGKS